MNLRKDIGKEKPKQDTNNLDGKIICISGTIPGYSRFKAQIVLRKKYKDVLFSENVTKKVDILLVGHGVGQRKLNLAMQYNIPIIEANKVL